MKVLDKLKQKPVKYIGPLLLLVIVAIFVVNVVTNGTVAHPGKISYESKCADCHGRQGEGIKTLVPPLFKSDYALQHFDSIPCWIRGGINHPITVNGVLYDQPMYGIALNDIEITNIMNYISSEMLQSNKTVSSQQVKEMLTHCK